GVAPRIQVETLVEKILVGIIPPPREEGWLRHQEIFGAALLSAADGVVAHTEVFGANDHPVLRVHPSSRGGTTSATYRLSSTTILESRISPIAIQGSRRCHTPKPPHQGQDRD